jgi:hypothetical protein
LVDNTASAYLIENSGGADYLKIVTTNSSEHIDFGNATENPYYRFLGTGGLSVGVPSAPLAPLHVGVSSSSTGATAFISQAGSGDAAVRLDAGSVSWSLGIDNSDGDGFTISESTGLGTNNKLQVLPSEGAIGLATSTDTGHWSRRARIETVEASTTDATATTLWSYTLAEGEAIMIDAQVIAMSSSESAVYGILGGARRYSGGSATEITGSEDTYAIGEEDASWDAYIDVSGNDVRLRVTLDGSSSCRAVARVTYHVITA